MKELREYFSGRGGYVFNQLKRTDCGYIYEVRGDGTRHYEVFERRINLMYDCISYPTDKGFGIWAWACMTLERAEEKLREITFRVENRETV